MGVIQFNDDSRKNQGRIIGKTMTQNTTKNDKREQCDTKDTKHNVLKTYMPTKIVINHNLNIKNLQKRRFLSYVTMNDPGCSSPIEILNKS